MQDEKNPVDFRGRLTFLTTAGSVIILARLDYHGNPTYLSAKREVVTKVLDIILQQEDETLIEGVVLTFHVCVPTHK